jgi:hypothetical protein
VCVYVCVVPRFELGPLYLPPRQVLLLLEPLHQPYFVVGIFSRQGLSNCLLRAGFDL